MFKDTNYIKSCVDMILDERNYKIMQMSGIPKIAEINRKIKGE